ncbi:MAG: GNAT family N-acetyltransferase [Methanotrichaceae archaeon]|nr:GNAT family N-acetyltransferase [Methanotrichaceae archaeon]
MVHIRLLSSKPEDAIEEIGQCVRIQEEVGYEGQIVPSHLFRAESIGLIEPSIDLGYILLALEGPKVVGYARVVYTRDREIHWLHQIVVSPALQSQGLGFELMKAVKAKSLEMGAEVLCFTYDPFEGRNGSLYLRKCGAKGVRVLEDFYGPMGSAAHGNRKSHRLLMRWDLLGERENWSAEKIPLSESLPNSWDRDILALEIPWQIGSLGGKEAALWQERTMPALVKAINQRGFQAVSLLSRPDELRNYLMLRREEAAGHE